MCAGVKPCLARGIERFDAAVDGGRGLVGKLLVDDRFGQRAEQAARGFELHGERPDRADHLGQRRIGLAQMGDGALGIEAEARHRWLEQRPGGKRRGALDLEDAPLGGDAARRREAAHLAVGAQHAMAGHDDGDGIAPQRLADLARFVRHAQTLGDLAVGHGPAGRNGARDLVDLAMELGRVVEIDRDVAEIDGLALQQGQHAIDDALHAGGRRTLDRLRPALLQARARGLGGRRGQLEAGNALGIPGDAAAADRRVEKGERLCGHGRTVHLTGHPVKWGFRRVISGRLAQARHLALDQGAIGPAAAHQLVGRAVLQHAPVLEEDDAVEARKVDSRWAMAITVRPCISRSSAWRIISSASLSSDDVASSSSTIGESFRSARATAMRWRWPPDSRVPRSPTMVE